MNIKISNNDIYLGYKHFLGDAYFFIHLESEYNVIVLLYPKV